jgi:hypothetical protein
MSKHNSLDWETKQRTYTTKQGKGGQRTRRQHVKVSDDTVRSLRRAYKDMGGKYGAITRLARQHNLHPQTASDIIHYKLRGDVTE